MQQCFITFLSQTAAFRAKKLAQEFYLQAKMVQTPKEISYGGCSYAIRCFRRDVDKIVSLCRENAISYSRVFAEFVGMNGQKVYEEYR